MKHPGSSAKPLFARDSRYSSRINVNSSNSRTLAKMWNEFVNAKKRMQSEGPFLSRHLVSKKCKTVFDSCLGTGADSIHLLGGGYPVVSNELDSNFVRMALKMAETEDVKLRILNYDWRDLEKLVDAESFDAVLCLGNSLTYLFDYRDQMAALEGFLHILHRDGILILDTRNYDYILDNRAQILENRSFHYSGKYVYCGTEGVHAFPIEISDDAVTFEYKHLKTGEIGHLILYPFSLQELRNLLETTGFVDISLFSDYREDFNPKADFYQFVCTKS